MNKNLALFEEKEIRKTWVDGKWFFCVVDVVEALTESLNSNDYWYRLKKRATEEEKIELSTICRKLKLVSTDGKKYNFDCADTEGILRIIQSIPSPKAEPFKRWLAKVGRERIDEINDPELAAIRMHDLYKKKGYADDWIDQRERGIYTRNILTDEWSNRGAKRGIDYAILTNEIYESGFGLSAKEYKDLKNINDNQNLRDSMTNLELALTNLGEATAVELHKKNNSIGLPKLKSDVNRAGVALNKAKQAVEEELETFVVTSKNYLDLTNKRYLEEKED